ncbi:PD40 domain-containing protein [Ktedonobacter sp. SOSP1-85]|uniref:PD40 domain-containing protein n=1 Tax=Ktedonobacter sp. SOSP1-85 TaxID=2778367 RepID=UPI001915D6C0|nr:PD40 domain-containing protein [Ktedonobacter sp. SOSP1-85]
MDKKRRNIVIAGLVTGSVFLGGGVVGRNMLRMVLQQKNSHPSLRSVKERFSFDLPSQTPKQLGWSPDSQFLAALTQSGEQEDVRVWDIQGHTMILNTSFPLNQSPAWSNAVNQSLAWSPDGKWLALASSDGIRLWSRQGGKLAEVQMIEKEKRSAVVSQDFRSTLAWSPDGRTLAYTAGRTIYLYDIQKRMLVGAYHRHEQEQSGDSISVEGFTMVWSPDGTFLASAGSITPINTHSLHIWHAATFNTVEVLQPLVEGYDWLQWSPNSKYLGFGNSRQMWMYNLPIRKTKLESKVFVLGLPATWSPDSQRFALFQKEDFVFLDRTTIQVRDFETDKVIYTCSLDDPNTLTWSPDGRFLAAMNYTRRDSDLSPQASAIHWYDAANGVELASIEPSRMLEHLLWSPNGGAISCLYRNEQYHGAMGLYNRLIVRCIVTIDVIGTQTEIAAQTIDQEGDYTLALKKNQGTLYQEVKKTFALAQAEASPTCSISFTRR